MKLQTPIDIAPSPWKIDYNDRILLLGSCFSDAVGGKMQEHYLPVTCNPFGTLYNPVSIAQAINYRSPISNELLPLVEYSGLWHSMAHHGSFSHPTREETEQAVLASIEKMQTALEEATVVIVTFGTAWVYETDGQVVGNCHKLPADRFTRRRLTVDEIVGTWQPIVEQHKDKHWIFTVSPIRHIKDGLHENQLSKATLLMAVNELLHLPSPREKGGEMCYFPSYEILLDELRDYRFYADDLVHPSSLAVNYIWERFADTFCTNRTKNELVLQHKRWKHEHHIPLHPV